ncbi:MAG: hypothetical protein ACLFM0_01705 [Spirochaetales bacterium]
MVIDFEKVGNYTLIAIGALTILSAIGTFFGTLDPLLEDWGIEQLAVPFGIMKLVIGALVLVGTTRLFASLIAISYYGGAVATHVAFESFNAQFAVVIILSIALWIGVFAKANGEK